MHDDVGPSELVIRSASAPDAETIAALHTASWQAHYRGSFSDAYLDGPIDAERRAFWTQRLAHPQAGQIVLAAQTKAQTLVGFVCLFLDHDETFGTLIDNLHVTVEVKRTGLGRRLMNRAGQAMLHALPRRPAYLYVLEANQSARRFYERIGGTAADHGRKTEPDGSEVSVLRYVWATPAALVESTSLN